MADSRFAAERTFEVREIVRVLAEHRVDYTVVGGVAVQAHGHTRTTMDLDLIARPELANLSRLAEALTELRASPRGTSRPLRHEDPMLLARAPQLALDTRYGRVDLLGFEQLAGAPHSYDELRDRALVVELGGVEVAFAGRDDLVRMKRAAGRDSDLRDVAALARTDEELEREARETGA